MHTMYKPEDIENARQNLSRYGWAQEIANGWAQSVAFAMQQDRAFFDTMIPELTPGTHYGQNCPNCVGKQSLMGGGLFDWHIDSPDEITCGACCALKQGGIHMQIFDRYTDLLQRIEQRGYPSQVLGHTPDGSPLVCLRTGGEKTPAIFISAGSHSTEQAGVGAAIGLLDVLDTEHQVYVIPTRDPMGMNGYAYALSLSLGEEPELNSVEDVEKILRARGEVLYEEDETVVAIIGEYGYSTKGIFGKFEVGADFLKPLFGRRIFFPSSAEGIEGTALCQRAYTLIVSPEGEVLHINRFHDTVWSPVEPRCTRNLMAEIQPGLTLDLHEYGGDGFWFSARHQRNENDEIWEKRMADAIIRAVVDSGAKLAPENYLPGSFFETGERGEFWLIAQERGEGLNLADYGAHQYGPSFTIETGMTMQGGYQERVQTSMLAAQTAISVFEERWR